jgi:hypothetical protein
MDTVTLFELGEATPVAPVAPGLPKRIQLMYARNGRVDGKCKDCIFLRRLGGYAGTYFKCSQSKLTHGAATDWRAGWDACGLYEVLP